MGQETIEIRFRNHIYSSYSGFNSNYMYLTTKALLLKST